MAPILKGRATAVLVKQDAEDEDVEYIASKQDQMVWHKSVGGCASWVRFTLVILLIMSIMTRRLDGMIYCFLIFSLSFTCVPCFRFGNISIIRYLITLTH